MDYFSESVKLHEKNHGKLRVESKVSLENRDDLSLAYTPGVAEPCREIAKDPEKVFDLTIKRNSVAVVTDGSAVLGLGNIGALASIPVMEGKCALFKRFAGIDAFPIAVESQEPREIISVVKNIAPVFGGINLEDIAAPKCFEVENSLQDLGIPVMHDDQHGTAIVVRAAMENATKVAGKDFGEMKIVISGAGAAGSAVAKMLGCVGNEGKCQPFSEIIVCDSKGAIWDGRMDLNESKIELAKITNPKKVKGTIAQVLAGADAFIGVSAPGIVSKEMVSSMKRNAIVLAMANPVPEIMPRDALDAGALVVGSGRSDFPNQVNNSLSFPGVFRGALDARAKRITQGMKSAAASALSGMVKNPTPEKILPSMFDEGVAQTVAEAVKATALGERYER